MSSAKKLLAFPFPVSSSNLQGQVVLEGESLLWDGLGVAARDADVDVCVLLEKLLKAFGKVFRIALCDAVVALAIQFDGKSLRAVSERRFQNPDYESV